MVKELHVFAHTHWDREWYQPFETYRAYLVAVVRKIVLDLESGDLCKFYLDGQSVVLEDVLEMAPELAPRLSRLMESGELAAGPWYVLADQLLVCGESLIRNLRLGIKTVAQFGRPALIGYCPDTFGHSLDLPRILSGCGIKSAILWRGAPDLEGEQAFFWESPDGSQVLTYLLARGYYQTAFHELLGGADDRLLAANMGKLADYLLPLVEDGCLPDGTSGLYDRSLGLSLYPIGADHAAPPARYVSKLKGLNDEFEKRGTKVRLVPIQLADFVELLEQRVEDKASHLRMVSRELRDNSTAFKHCAAYILPGVLSTRLYLKKANRHLEQSLFRNYEPLFASLHLRGMLEYPSAELDHALKLLLKNQPHDSICGCSVDAVHQEMISRYARAEHVLSALKEKADDVRTGLPEESGMSFCDPDLHYKNLVVVNAAPVPRSAPVPVRFYVNPGAKLNLDRNVFQLEKRCFSDQLFAGWGKTPYYKNVDIVEGWVWAENVPATGESILPWPGLSGNSSANIAPVRARDKILDNGLLQVSVDGQGDLVVVSLLPGCKPVTYKLRHRFRDVGDAGDTYNFDPIANDKAVFSRLKSTRIGQKGRLLSSLILRYEIDIPQGLIIGKQPSGGIAEIKRSSTKIKHEIEVELTVKRGSSMLFFDTSWRNESSGHRLEVLFDCERPIHASFSENHFSLVQRFHQTSKKPVALPVKPAHEAPCDRYPAQRFVIANGQVFLNSGLPEYGVEGKSLSLTVLRSVSILSRGRMRTRGGGAGPHLEVKEAACLGWNQVSYAWAPLVLHDQKQALLDLLSDENRVQAYAYADEFEHNMQATLSVKQDLPERFCLAQVNNPCLRLSGMYIADEGKTLVLRVLNVANKKHQGRLYLNFDFRSVQNCNLLEQEQEPLVYRQYPEDLSGFDQALRSQSLSWIEFELGPNELRTIKLRLQQDAKRQTIKRAGKKKAKA